MITRENSQITKNVNEGEVYLVLYTSEVTQNTIHENRNFKGSFKIKELIHQSGIENNRKFFFNIKRARAPGSISVYSVCKLQIVPGNYRDKNIYQILDVAGSRFKRDPRGERALDNNVAPL